ncbi:transcriptional regulator TAC1-like protein [Trifolium pratense]|uniref:Transcriptional regulator TAC1-like protein n=2 Tax=Trifolium pratense TaxID=57577 RepID=A0A2K3LE10_TRIPR|nr:transcriptional regulator TAC1-like [Trifolium pratense]PNX76760.1 transcriptional regulator TAC1-like protein [Trifolium pratense]CAJ2628097.1 unnamed protein product [Trifolium pratense]
MNSSEEGGGDDNQGKKCSYECTFCKRGFTNAQALGGHMNIHRKDRSKASKQSNYSSSSQVSNKFFTNDEGVAFPYANSEQHMSQNFDHGMYFQHQYFPTPPPNNYLVGNNYQPSNVHGFGYEYSRSSSNWSNLHLNQELQGPNLSLQIGSSQHYVDNTHHQRIKRGNDEEENEVDLELRLGHDP